MKLSFLLALAPLSHAATMITTFDVNGLEANQGTADQTGLNHVQTLTQSQDFTGDGIADSITYEVVTGSTDGITDLNPGGSQYTFRTVGGDYEMFVNFVSFTSSDPAYTFVSLDGELTSFFKSGNGSYTVTDGTTSLTNAVNNTTVTSATPLLFDDTAPLTWSGNGNNGPRNLGIEFIVCVVPEPSSAALLGLAGLGLVSRRKRA